MNLTIGQHYPVDSIIHRLDARTKIIAVILYITAVFAAKGLAGYILCTLFLAVCIALCRVPVRLMLSGLKNIIIIILFTVVLNILFIRTGEELFSLGAIHITTGGVFVSLRLCVRLVLLIMGSSLLTLTTSPISLTEGIEALLGPFKKIGVPSHEIAMMMSIALRFIPTLAEELDKIKKAQTARGADFETGGIVARAKSMIPLLVPLFVSSFRRADELAMAMEARCYRGDVHRTRMKSLKYGRIDYMAYMLIILLVAAVFLLRKLGV